MTNHVVCNQSATGLSRGKFDSVSFQVEIEGRGNLGPEAKESLKPAVNRLADALASLKSQGVSFEDEEDRSTFSLVKENRYDDKAGRQVFAGYLASYNLHVESSDVEKASLIQDVLTSVEGAEVSSPSFTMKPEQRRTLQKEAVKHAFGVIQQRLAEECEVLGLNPDEFEIHTFNANYGRRSVAETYTAEALCSPAAGGSDPNSPIEIRSGLANVEVTLTVSYAFKYQHGGRVERL